VEKSEIIYGFSAFELHICRTLLFFPLLHCRCKNTKIIDIVKNKNEKAFKQAQF